MKKLGVIGGLGPMATAYFYQLVTQMTNARYDQDHIEILLHSKPSIPDRTKYILGESKENPVQDIIGVGKTLEEMGAQVLAIPCITAHYFHEEITKEIQIPVIHLITETVAYLKERNISKVGIMATDGTVQSRLFQEAFEENQMQCIVPQGEFQEKVMHIIYNNVKAGITPEMECFNAVSKHLFENGAQVIILACTELSIVKRDFTLPAGYLDVLDVLAYKSVSMCGSIREEYLELITKEERNV